MNSDSWGDPRARRENRNPLRNMLVRAPLAIEGDELVLKIDPKQPVGLGSGGGLAVFYDPGTMGVKAGSPYGLTARGSAVVNGSKQSSVPKALIFLGW